MRRSYLLSESATCRHQQPVPQVRRFRQLVESSSFAENAPLRIDCKAKPPKREDTHYALVERLLPSDSLPAFLGQRTSKGESIRYWSVLDLNSFFW
jgi:hypothetical protein